MFLPLAVKLKCPGGIENENDSYCLPASQPYLCLSAKPHQTIEKFDNEKCFPGSLPAIMTIISADSSAEIFFEMTWSSAVAGHTDTYAAQAVNLWRDLLPESSAAALQGKQPGERVEITLDGEHLFADSHGQVRRRLQRRRYLWILGRQQHVAQQSYEQALNAIRDNGLDPERLLPTAHIRDEPSAD